MLCLPFGYTDTVTEKHQTLSWWRLQSPSWNWTSGAEADLLKELYNRDHADSLLFLAQQKDVAIKTLRRITYSHFFHYGIDRV